jgi:hypothetical protein
VDYRVSSLLCQPLCNGKFLVFLETWKAEDTHTHTSTYTHTHEHIHTHEHAHTHTSTYTHTRARTHTRAHIHTRADTHTRTYTHTHTRAHIHTRAGTHTRAYTHTRARTHTRAHIHIHTRAHTHAHTYTRAHTHTHTHTSTHTHEHTHTHTSTYTHIHTRAHRVLVVIVWKGVEGLCLFVPVSTSLLTRCNSCMERSDSWEIFGRYCSSPRHTNIMAWHFYSLVRLITMLRYGFAETLIRNIIFNTGMKCVLWRPKRMFIGYTLSVFFFQRNRMRYNSGKYFAQFWAEQTLVETPAGQFRGPSR